MGTTISLELNRDSCLTIPRFDTLLKSAVLYPKLLACCALVAKATGCTDRFRKLDAASVEDASGEADMGSEIEVAEVRFPVTPAFQFQRLFRFGV